MCWNQTVSLSTFLFSTFVLFLIIYNNEYTEHKIQELNNIWIYILLFTVISMQLIEFFIWRNIKNAFYNNLFTWAADILLLLQPAFSLMILPDIPIRTGLLGVYSISALVFFIYQFLFYRPHSTVSKLGHLRWHTSNINIWLLWIIWLFFFCFSLVYTNFISGFLFSIVLLAIIFFNYKNDQSIGSMWCWIVNLAAVYYAFYLLFIYFLSNGNPVANSDYNPSNSYY
jgi:hypothetical protein